MHTYDTESSHPAGLRRHPVGLAVVVGLHAALAVVLVMNGTIPRPHLPGDTRTEILPEAPKPPPPPVVDLPTPKVQMPSVTQIVLPPLDVTPQAPVDDTPVLRGTTERTPATEGPATGGTQVAIADKPASQISLARHAVIDARSASCRPSYPPQAQRVGAQGISRLRFTVDATGRVTRVDTLAPAGPSREHRLLDRAAADALQSCPITVGRDDAGRAVGTTVDVDYVWTLE